MATNSLPGAVLREASTGHASRLMWQNMSKNVIHAKEPRRQPKVIAASSNPSPYPHKHGRTSVWTSLKDCHVLTGRNVYWLW
ncbi:hypothetical protein Dimus_038735 [Dionaea muscipula]